MAAGHTPSDALLDSAAGPDSATVLAKAMLEEAPATTVMRQFHAELLHFDRYAQISKANVPSYNPSLNAEFPDVSNLFFDKIFAQNLGVKDILTTSSGFVGPGTAPLYGLTAPPSGDVHRRKMDNQRSATSATDAVAKFRAANMRAATSKPYAPVMTCTSTDSGHPMVDPGCITYDGCSVPTIWCSHNDPSYSGTQHGVPCCAIKAMYDFFAALP